MLLQVVFCHQNKIKQYQSLSYLVFQRKLIEFSKEPYFATAYFNALASLFKTRYKYIFDYMHRANILYSRPICTLRMFYNGVF